MKLSFLSHDSSECHGPQQPKHVATTGATTATKLRFVVKHSYVHVVGDLSLANILFF